MAQAKKTTPAKATETKATAVKATETKATVKAAPAAKVEAPKAVATTAAEKKAPAKKAAPAKTTTAAAAKKAPAKKAPAKKAVSMFIEFNGVKVQVDEIVKNVEATYKAQGGKDAVKSLEIYVKPEENAAYFVVNGQLEGNKMDVFFC